MRLLRSVTIRFDVILIFKLFCSYNNVVNKDHFFQYDKKACCLQSIRNNIILNTRLQSNNIDKMRFDIIY